MAEAAPVAFLKAGRGAESPLAVPGRGVLLRPFAMSDYAPWAEIRALSRAHLEPWEPRWPRDELSRAAFRRRLRHYQRESREDLGYAFGIFLGGDEPLAGGVSLSNVRRGVAQSASLGYWLGRPYTKQGIMTEAIRALLPFAWGPLRLHRVEAAAMPANEASLRVLERAGFIREGYGRSYLEIDGVWRDHILFARLADDPPAKETPR